MSNQNISGDLRKKALVVGIDFYNVYKPDLKACVKDANAVKRALEYNSDGSRNFSVDMDISLDLRTPVDQAHLKNKIQELFSSESDIALFYFAGHGQRVDEHGYLITNVVGREGSELSMQWLLDQANESKAKHTVIVLDCCHAGAMGNCRERLGFSKLSSGVSIIAATEEDDFSAENLDTGVFTDLFVQALNGGAANLYGVVSVSSIYAYIEKQLGFWNQRPVFKSYVDDVVVIKQAMPPVEVRLLSRLLDLFDSPDELYKLDPEYEPTSNVAVRHKCEIFSELQKLTWVNLVEPVGELHMYYAAMKNKACRLTSRGRFFWKTLKVAQKSRLSRDVI